MHSTTPPLAKKLTDFHEVTLNDLKPMNFLGAGAFSTVRLVEHRTLR